LLGVLDTAGRSASLVLAVLLALALASCGDSTKMQEVLRSYILQITDFCKRRERVSVCDVADVHSFRRNRSSTCLPLKCNKLSS
jgi:hypothetical protein